MTGFFKSQNVFLLKGKVSNGQLLQKTYVIVPLATCMQLKFNFSFLKGNNVCIDKIEKYIGYLSVE